MKHALPAAMALLLLTAPQVSAADRGQLPRMLAVAQQYFAAHAHNCPLSGDVVVIGAEELDYYDTLTGVWVDWAPHQSMAHERGGYAAGMGGGCNIQLDEGSFDRMTFGDACKLVVHEAGHAFGLDHDDSHPNIMHSNALNAMGPFGPCELANPYRQIIVRVRVRLRKLNRFCRGLGRRPYTARRADRSDRCWERSWRTVERLEALA